MPEERVETHIDDLIRVGVLGALEEAKLRFVPHLMDCPRCQERLLDVVDELDAFTEAEHFPELTCEQVRNSVVQLLDSGKSLTPELLAHLRRCEDCYDLFIEPAMALRALEADETGEVG